jgi:hypothetical protein
MCKHLENFDFKKWIRRILRHTATCTFLKATTLHICTLAGFDLTTHSSSLLGGRRRRYHYTLPGQLLLAFWNPAGVVKRNIFAKLDMKNSRKPLQWPFSLPTMYRAIYCPQWASERINKVVQMPTMPIEWRGFVCLFQRRPSSFVSISEVEIFLDSTFKEKGARIIIQCKKASRGAWNFVRSGGDQMSLSKKSLQM